MRHFRHWLRWRLYRLEARAYIRVNGLPVVARAMFELNHHARGVKGDAGLIYALKNVLVRELYHRVPSIVQLHAQPLWCWSCEGTGRYPWSGEICWKCGGSGCYRTNWLYLFRFQVGSRHYSWHQPERYVDWPLTEVEVLDEPFRERPAVALLRLPDDARWALTAVVYEWLRGVGVPAEELPPAPTLRWALAWTWHDVRAAWRRRMGQRRPRLAVVEYESDDEIPF